MTSSDEIVRIVETAEILAFPRGAKSGEGPPSSGGDAPPREPPRLPPEQPPEPPVPPPDDGDETRDAIDDLNKEFSLVLMGTGVRVFREQPLKPIRNIQRIMTVEAFNIFLANRNVKVRQLKEQNDGSYRWVTAYKNAAAYWLRHKERRTFDSVEFWPNPDGAPGIDGYLNLYRGFAIAPDRSAPANDRWKLYKIFRDHLLNNICCGDHSHFIWIWAWLAHLIQRPRERIGTAIVLRGRFGVGKTTIGEVIGKLIAPHYFLVDEQRYVTGQFNTHMAACLLLQVDEGVWAGNKDAEGRLKSLITGPTQMIEAKGVDAVPVNNYVRLIFTSNNDWVVPTGPDERRFAVFDVGDGVKENHGYFAEMWAELQNGGLPALLADLMDYDLTAPGAPNLRLVPRTEALLEQKIRSFDPITAWWLSRLENRTQTHRASNWRPRVPISTMFNDYVRTAERVGVKRKSSETEFGIKMKKIMPGLRKVRVMEEVEEIGEDGRYSTRTKRANCWIFPSLDECRAMFEAQIGQPYEWGEDDDAAPLPARDETEGDVA